MEGRNRLFYLYMQLYWPFPVLLFKTLVHLLCFPELHNTLQNICSPGFPSVFTSVHNLNKISLLFFFGLQVWHFSCGSEFTRKTTTLLSPEQAWLCSLPLGHPHLLQIIVLPHSKKKKQIIILYFYRLIPLSLLTF